MEKHWTLTIAAAAVVLLLLSGGCQPVGSEEFEPEGPERTVYRFNNVQAASGARADAMLYPFHFDGAELNALGEQKLDLMLDDDDAFEPMVVYMRVREDELLNNRMAAVTAYLKGSGLGDEQIKFELGDNPNARHPAGPGVAAMTRMRNQSAGQADRSATEDRAAGAEGSASGMGIGLDSK